MTSPLPALLAATCLAACATGGGARPVKAVALHGNKTFDEGDIVERLATRPPHGWLVRVQEEFDPVAADVDADRIETWYRERGWFDAKVTGVRNRVRPGGGVEVDFDVEEGEVTTVAAVTVEGDDAAEARRLLDAEGGLAVGRPYMEAEYTGAKTLLERWLQRRGYAFGKVPGKVLVDRAGHRATVRFKLAPGPLAAFGKTAILGLGRIAEETVRNRLAWREGDRFDPSLIERTEGRLFALGVFSSVRASFSRSKPEPIIQMTITVGEATTREVELGVGAAIDLASLQLHGRAGSTIRGILGQPLLSFHADATPGWSWLRGPPYTSAPSIAAATSLERDDLFFTTLHGQLLAAFDRQPHFGYVLTGPRFGAGLSAPLDSKEDLKLTVGWQLQYLVYSDFDAAVFGSEAASSWLGHFSQQLVLDERDRPLAARSGWYLALELLEGGPAAGGPAAFLKVTPEARGYLPLGRRLVLAARARFGLLLTRSADLAPLPLRYLGGGANDQRGFGFQRLSPSRLDASGARVPVGGSEALLVSGEARLELFRVLAQWLSVVAFLDAGDVTAPGRLDLLDLHYAAGLGLRYATAIGPIRTDLGYRLNRTAVAGPDGLANPDPGSFWAFQLSLGEAF